MAKPAPPSTVVALRVNINCCEHCSKKVKKLLLKVAGVEAVEVDREKRLVHVTGKADTKLLIKAVAKMKKKAEVVPNENKNESESSKKEEEKQSEGGNSNEACCALHPPSNGYFQGYDQMPPIAYYNYPPYMRSTQDQFSHFSINPHQGYGYNYPGQCWPRY